MTGIVKVPALKNWPLVGFPLEAKTIVPEMLVITGQAAALPMPGVNAAPEYESVIVFDVCANDVCGTHAAKIAAHANSATPKGD
jgi:hypothetical protein